MKKITVPFYTFLLIFLFSCSQNRIETPEQIGMQAFKVLKDFSDIAEFRSNLASIEEIREIGNIENIDYDVRNVFTNSVTKKERAEQINRDFDRIREKGTKHKIIWENIEYYDFMYNIKTNGDLKICQGTLHFIYENKIYKFEVLSFFNGNEYKLWHFYPSF